MWALKKNPPRSYIAEIVYIYIYMRERERETRENKTTVQTCHGLKQVLIQIFALQESFFKAWFANAVPMAATITRQNL